MPIADLSKPLTLARGPAMKNRLMLAPLTNQQSNEDGTLSEDETRWLTMRAEGGFALIRTAAAPVQKVGQGYPGQLGIYDDLHLPGLRGLARAIRASGALSAVQLYHGGDRASPELVGTPVSPTNGSRNGARQLALDEVEQLRDDFIAAAVRAESAGFDGVEVHGAHGYILAQFLSPQINQRSDSYGGSFENRARLMLEVIDGIRKRCRPDFQVGLRLSPERFGMKLGEVRELASEIMHLGKIDYLDMSLWDSFKDPHEEAYHGRSLLSYFTDIPRGDVRLSVAGKIMSMQDAANLIDSGCDFVSIGRAAILRHDFPEQVKQVPPYDSPALPVSESLLREQGAGAPFIAYLRTFPGMVRESDLPD